MSKGTKGMTKSAASRIQSHADRSGSNQSFKGRAQRAAAKNSGSSRSGATKGPGRRK